MADKQVLIDVVSMEVHQMVMQERDIAMLQLEEHGIPFGGVAPDVVKVTRCEHCKYSEDNVCPRGKVWCKHMCRYMKYDGFCSEGDTR